ncbi:MAG: hypothetical protein U9R25_05725 [Chloroflexota bacterium]|nr:hypothetical protein [Chloroflexota bacterium]
MIKLIVHATHEAGLKVGGIGAVLDGLLATPGYNEAVERTVLVGTWNHYDSAMVERMLAPRNKLDVIYSPVLGVVKTEPQLAAKLSAVEKDYGVSLLYGRRRFGPAGHEVILVHSIHAKEEPVNSFKYYLWRHYGIDSGEYEYDFEFKDFVRSAPASYAALSALVGPGAGLPGLPDNGRFMLAHEWMGLPLVFAAQLTDPWEWRTIFYAHEMATARNIVEFDGGHDTRFYNAMETADAYGLTMEQVFGDRDAFFKHVLIEQTVRCDNIFAVGDLVVDELRFLGGLFRTINIDLVYNGVPSFELSLKKKLASKKRLQDYAENLFGDRPDYVFSHVTRMVLSKAMWRDIRVAEHLDSMLAEKGKSAVLFMLSTSALRPGGRNPEDIRRWEEEYGWPVHHRSDNGDLTDLEIPLYNSIAAFNWNSQALKIVLVNQFGWSQDRCGKRMPADMEFMDIRFGSDAEFGQSIYEPFGIAQVEPLSFGALCVVSNVCGCVGFVRKAIAQANLDEFPNLVVADYTTLPPAFRVLSPWDALHLGTDQRDQIEAINSTYVARQIIERLPENESEMQRLLDAGQAVGSRMSWDVIASEYLLRGLKNATT